MRKMRWLTIRAGKPLHPSDCRFQNIPAERANSYLRHRAAADATHHQLRAAQPLDCRRPYPRRKLER